VSILNAELTRREPEILGVSDDGTTFTVRFRAPLSCGWVQVHVQSTAAGEGGISAYDDTNYTSTTLVDCRADRLQDVTVTLVAAVQNIVYLIPVQYDAAGTKVLFDGEGTSPDNMASVTSTGIYTSVSNTFTVPQLFADGLVGAPSVAFANDTDNGLYLDVGYGANVWTLAAGGVAALRMGAATGGVQAVMATTGATPVFVVAGSVTATANGQFLKGQSISCLFANAGAYTSLTVTGLQFSPQFGSSGSQTFAAGVSLRLAGGAGGTPTVTDWRGLQVDPPSGVTLTTAYGVYITALGGTTGYGLWIGNQANYAIYTGTGTTRLGGGVIVPHVSKATGYTLTGNDFLVTVTAACTIELPAAASHTGRQYKIHADANNVIVDDIEGSNFTLMLGETLDVYSNGTEWFA